MPNPYHYFESGEISPERLLLEIELLKELKKADLLYNLDWASYDTHALKCFLDAGIEEVKEELTQRFRAKTNDFKQYDFICQSIQKHQVSPIGENFKKQQISFTVIFNTIFIFICIFFVIGLFTYEYIKIDHQHHLLKSLDHPLTAKQRRLSFANDLSIIFLAFASGISLGCIIIATRFRRKIIILGIVTLCIIMILVTRKIHQIITFLSTYREIRWPMLYDYMFS
ncbi:unnamed protein product [Rotaria magnacalcarata]|uniref:Uncharacterized protein n=1 Tax=Rotaria magnacalcarata TaxID=392030 RepID=A0A816KR96_9BILA|nr:unnamed protein product [Rotaria magnacalcarata]